MSSISGGCINNCFHLKLNNGVELFLKENSDQYKDMFKVEAEGLKALSNTKGPRIPEVYSVDTMQNKQYLTLEYIYPGNKNKNFWENFGRNLAIMHNLNSSDFYGFNNNNYIGSTKQINNIEKSWISFFGHNRLYYQAKLALKNNLCDYTLLKKIEKIISKLPDIIDEPQKSSLLHGDLWGGNYMVDTNGDAVLIDPAVYYGHREADLAMTELFGSFNTIFYKSYNETYPLLPGYRERKDLYNLYHILNHLNLFGSSYISSALSIINKYL